MSTIKRNVAANVAAKVWAALLSLAFVPVYLKLLGIEAYGLIGFFLTLTAACSLLDLGLGTALNRKLAQLTTAQGSAQEMRDALYTLEFIYWLIGVTIGVIVIAIAPYIAEHWIKAQQLSADSIAQAVALMGIAIASLWPLTLYTGGLMGIQKQVPLGVLASVMVTVRNVGAVAIIWLISPTIQAFFIWQIAVSVVETILSGWLLRYYLPAAPARASFSVRRIAEIWKFAAGVTGISLMAVILTQLDKIILSKILLLEAYGYYTLAWRVAASLYYLAVPINSAFFPRFSQLAVLADTKELARLYHGACQLLAVITLPVTVVLALYAEEFLYLWTLDPVTVANSSTLLKLLVIGTAINALMTLPLSLQLAHGWTRLVFTINTIAVVALGPLIYLMTQRYGAVGAAGVWIALNCCYVIFMLQIMHRRLLPGHLHTWLITDFALPLAAALAVAGVWKLAVVTPGSYGWMLCNLVAVSVLTAGAAALAAPQIRAQVSREFRMLRQ